MSTPPIVLPPSDSQDALVNAISHAMTANATLLLEPGVHIRAPGCCSALRWARTGFGSGRPALRPCRSHRRSRKRAFDGRITRSTPDSNFGLFFIPTGPTDEEVAQVKWKPASDGDGPFEYGVVMRGRIEISRLLMDCNMQNQALEATPKAAEHSAMLGFSGFRYPVKSPLRRFVYVGFESVALTEMGFVNGGFADDVWVTYTHGAFHPNIEQVSINQVASAHRIHPRRATLSFTGLAHRIMIHDADVYNLHAEQDGDWKNAPAPRRCIQ